MSTTTSESDTTTDTTDTVESTTPEAPERSCGPDTAPSDVTRSRRQLSVSVSTVVVGIVIAALLAACCTFAGLWLSARSTVSAAEARAADTRHAEQVATDYAVGAATTDYRDLSAWFDKLKSNTSPALSAKFDATAPQLQQILTPLNWVSTASPITSTVSSSANGVYQVDAFVTVSSTSKQAPNGAKTTVTYKVTVDGNNGWTITDVGGLDGGLPN